MDQQERIGLIRQLIDSGTEIAALDVMNVLNIDTVTLAWDFRHLIKEGEILLVRPGVYQKRFDVRKYLAQPLALREKKSYNAEFLENYIPNKTPLWTDEELIELQELQSNGNFWFNYRLYLEQIENFLYDISEFCSLLDKSAYKRKDIEIYLRHWVRPDWIPFEQSYHITNFLKAFEFIRDSYEESFLMLHDFEDMSRIICDKRIADTELWKLRSFVLELNEVAYIPLSDDNQLEKQYELSLEKLRKIQNPFEKMLFILVYISYLLPFSDGNKELTYFMGNIPLLQSWYAPFTFYWADMTEFDIAYKALYELSDIVILKELILNMYKKNISRYTCS